jgi:hypothetical protein
MVPIHDPFPREIDEGSLTSAPQKILLETKNKFGAANIIIGYVRLEKEGVFYLTLAQIES